MDGLDVFAFIVMFVILIAIGWLIYVLGALPGQIARKRQHPEAGAVNVCGWLGLITLGLLWPVAIIWAHLLPRTTTPAAEASSGAALDFESIQARLTKLEASIDRLTQRAATEGDS